MIIDSAIRLALAAGCLTAIAALSTAHAQMGGGPAPGSYGPPGAYGFGSPSSPYGYGSPQETYPPPRAYGPTTGPYGPPPAPMATVLRKEPILQAPMARRRAPMARLQAPIRRHSMARRLREPS